MTDPDIAAPPLPSTKTEKMSDIVPEYFDLHKVDSINRVNVVKKRNQELRANRDNLEGLVKKSLNGSDAIDETQDQGAQYSAAAAVISELVKEAYVATDGKAPEKLTEDKINSKLRDMNIDKQYAELIKEAIEAPSLRYGELGEDSSIKRMYDWVANEKHVEGKRINYLQQTIFKLAQENYKELEVLHDLAGDHLDVQFEPSANPNTVFKKLQQKLQMDMTKYDMDKGGVDAKPKGSTAGYPDMKTNRNYFSKN
ncbi:MAG: hypothetical protein ABIC95_02820 [archaeon]